MTMNAGVWIDHHKATVVLITDDGEDVRQFLSDENASRRSIAGVRVKNSFTRNDFVAEDTRERKVMVRLNKYYDEVIACLHDADTILVLGPGKAKGEFTKRFAGKKLKGHVAEMRTTDRLTENQIAERVREHFRV